MSELLFSVLTDESARDADAAKAKVLQSSEAFTPWASAKDQ